MAVNQISEAWRMAVCRILREQDRQKINLTLQAQLDWQTYFADFWFFDLYDGICDYLGQDGCCGQLVEGMVPPGTVYEFIFRIKNRPVYCKINLTPQGGVIIIYSAHPPRKGDTL